MDCPLILTFDIGTQSMRGILVDAQGNFVASKQLRYQPAYYSPKANWAQQKPNYYYEILCQISLELKEKYPEEYKRIKGVTLTCFRDSVVFLDEDLKPLRDIILWLDQRKSVYQGEFGSVKTTLFHLVNMYDTAVMQYEMTPANWVRQNEPEIWAKTKKYVMVPTYLNYQLTGLLKDNPANQTGHLPIDYKTGKWLKPGALNTAIFNIPPSLLCELSEPAGYIGKITKKAAQDSGIPQGTDLISSGPDKECETLGLSVNSPGKAAISLGTAATIDLASNHYFEPQPFLPSYPAIEPGMYNHDVQIYRGYWMINWFIEQFGKEDKVEAKERNIAIEELMNEKLLKINPGSDGLIVQPYWQPGLEQPNAHGAILGFTDQHTRDHFYRAIVEGIGFSLMKGLDTMLSRSNLTVNELYAAGGGSRSSVICQIMADMFGLPLKRIQTNEASALGSAISCFVSLKVYPDYATAISKMVRVKDEFKPDKKNHEIYQAIYQKVYKNLYTTSLEKVNEELKTLYRKGLFTD